MLQSHGLYAEAAQHLTASRLLFMQWLWTQTIPSSAGLASWPLHCLIFVSAWPPGLVTEQEGLFCWSLGCWSFPAHPASGFLAGCRGKQVSPSPTVLCSPIPSTLDSGQPPHQHHCQGLCESHGERAENAPESVSHFPQPHSTWQSRSKDPGRGSSLPAHSFGRSSAAELAPSTCLPQPASPGAACKE